MGWADFANTALQVGASYYSSKQQADAAKSAGKTAAAGSDASTALQREIYNDQRNLNMPFYQGGLSAYDRYMRLMGLGGVPQSGGGAFSPQGSTTGQIGSATPTQWFGSAKGVTPNQQLMASDPRYAAAWNEISAQQKAGYGEGFNNNSTQKGWVDRLKAAYGAQPAPQSATPTASSQPALTQQQSFAAFRDTPGYQFGLDEGNKQVQTSAAARGGLYSGAAMKSLQKFGNDYADQQGYTPYMNRLAGLFGGAQTASGAVGNAGQNYANQAGANMQNAADSRATGIWRAGQAQADGTESAAGFLGRYYKNNNGWGG